MAHKDRVHRYKTEGGAAELVRVEVLIPPQDRGALLEQAAQMRAVYRQKKSQSNLAALHQQAMQNFSASCLWNMKPSPTPAGMRLLADQLRKYGGMDAWRLASQIRKVLASAA